MKVLMAAIACSPASGSEAYVGWQAARTLAQDHEVWVLTQPDYRAAIEKAAACGEVPAHLHFHYVGEQRPNSPNRLLAKIQSWTDYGRWCRGAREVAIELHARVRFDIAQHLTYCTWRVESPLWSLGIPFVWGPIGGAENFPPRFLSMLSPSAMVFELARFASNAASTCSPKVRICARRAAIVFAANAETEKKLRALRGSGEGVERLPGSFFDAEKVARFRLPTPKPPAADGVLRIFAGGNLEGRKGVAIALQALALAKSRGLRFRYQLGGTGPEAAYLRRLAGELGLSTEVFFGEGFSGDAYRQELQRSDVYLLPSLRDNAPITLMEAMLAGCVPVVADCGGPGEFVMPECGFAVPVTTARQMAERIGTILLELQADPEKRARLGSAATSRIGNHFTAENYRQRVNAAYQVAVQYRQGVRE